MKEEIQKTEIRMAEVRARFDPNQEGVFYAGIEGISDGASLMINYVSPYGSAAKAGFIGVPEVGASILVCKPSGSNEWFYIGSTFLPEDKKQGEDTPTTPPFSRVDPKINKVSGVPAKVILHGNNGQGLEISDEQDGKTTNNIKTELTSSNGKKITMHDSPGIDAIKLDSGNNASITLTQNPQNNPQKSAASIEIDCNGPQMHICRESDMDLKVLGGGRELNIQNSSNGIAWGRIAGVPVPNPIVPAGNVNIQSDRGDVNIMAKSPYTGRIFIETLNALGQRQLIKLGTAGPDGSIVLQANSIVLDATGTELLPGTIDLNAPGGVFINGGAGGVHTTATGFVNTNAGTGVNIDPGSAGVINLANGPTAIPNSPRYVENVNPVDIYKIDDYFGRGLE
jgi:hypothetical protein